MSCHAGEIQTVRDGSKGPSVLGVFCLSRTSTPLSGSFSTNKSNPVSTTKLFQWLVQQAAAVVSAVIIFSVTLSEAAGF